MYERSKFGLGPLAAPLDLAAPLAEATIALYVSSVRQFLDMQQPPLPPPPPPPLPSSDDAITSFCPSLQSQHCILFLLASMATIWEVPVI
jgi:hypothetical protein